MTDHFATLEELLSAAKLGFDHIDRVSHGNDWLKVQSAIAQAETAIALMRGQSWQPIETAPKDETTILVYSPELRNAETAWWDGHGWSYNWHEYDGSSYLKSVTHWQPLPAPPKDTADE